MQFNIQRFGFGLAATLILASGSAFAKQEWKFQINVNAGDDEYRIAQEWAKSVGEKTNGEITVEVLPTGTIVGNNETLDAVGAGIIQGHITDPGYFSGKNPAFAVYGNMVVPGAARHRSWITCATLAARRVTTVWWSRTTFTLSVLALWARSP
ncbi:hypothetical protein [Stutzerimonas zhaodongensis]|uniref:hypothetical protein n=1 Tax=Stutzerimonas zhaodongensis TaxID=1176257 RepID=UPI00237C3AC8|nr:hypothetical protein [Stutzerimonas zhaodongensis]